MSTQRQRICFLQGLLTNKDQLHLFDYVHRLDVTDWDHLSQQQCCMNPTPKTLELYHPNNSSSGESESARSSSSIYLNPNDETNNIVIELVKKVINNINNNNNDNSVLVVGKQQQQQQQQSIIQSISMAVIRYCPKGTHPCIGSCFPPHIDHCNDGSWVVLFSLGGCIANFHVKTPVMKQTETYRMQSGDVIVFDPSSEAAILHGVDVESVEKIEDEEEEDCLLVRSSWTKLKLEEEKFQMFCCSRFGVQCRVSFH